eukprot:TRINITY_DN64429_c0_g1_i2.p1 TRINITY_DN64429_c0_g1~~TRINITY_DN64429_c0_g1_i2.p1  ORF type:complete len:751 (-),score=161.68 TRINITY_DN64429_c0_g1_i2:142-2250(-)
MAEPIHITMPTPKANLSEGTGCWSFDEAAGVWTNEGLYEVDLGDGSFTCATTHLTLFGAILLEAFAKALKCSNAKVLSKEGLDKIGDGFWWIRPAALVIWLLVGIHVVLLYVAWELDKDNAETWSDKLFFTTESGHKPSESALADLKDDAREVYEKLKKETATLRDDWKTRYSFLGLMAYRLAIFVNFKVGKRVASASLNMAERDIHFFEKTAKTRHRQSRRRSMRLSRADRASLAANGAASDLANNEAQGVQQPAATEPEQHCDSTMKFTRLSNMVHAHIQKTTVDVATLPHWRIFLYSVEAAHPYPAMMQFSLGCPRTIRALLFTAKVFGALMVSALFFLTGAQDGTSDPECTPGYPAEALVMIVVVGILASLFSSIPMAIMIALRKRDFVYVSSMEDRKVRTTLRMWWIKDTILWVLMSAYIAFCLLFLAAFHANVSEFDATKWLMAACVSIVKEVILVPLLLSLVFAGTAKLLAASTRVIEGASRRASLYVTEEPKPVTDGRPPACGGTDDPSPTTEPTTAEALAELAENWDCLDDAADYTEDLLDVLDSPRQRGLQQANGLRPHPDPGQGFEAFQAAMMNLDAEEDALPAPPALDDWPQEKGNLAAACLFPPSEEELADNPAELLAAATPSFLTARSNTGRDGWSSPASAAAHAGQGALCLVGESSPRPPQPLSAASYAGDAANEELARASFLNEPY